MEREREEEYAEERERIFVHERDSEEEQQENQKEKRSSNWSSICVVVVYSKIRKVSLMCLHTAVEIDVHDKRIA